MAELKPCPFCGGTKLEITNPMGAGSFANITCLDCYATGGLGITKQDAINKWNIRTPKNDEVRE